MWIDFSILFGIVGFIMLKNLGKITSTLIVIAILTGCRTNINASTLVNSSQQEKGSVLIQSFVSSVDKSQNEQEIVLDEDYYNYNPDAVMANQLDTVQTSGVVPEYPADVAAQNTVKTQSFFSLFSKKVTIDVYDSFGTPKKFSISGRVYKKENVDNVNTGDSALTNLFRHLKYFTPNPVKDIQIKVTVNGISKVATTSSKGFFTATFDNTDIKDGINSVVADLVVKKYDYTEPKEEVIIDDENSEKIGIISDIDDTIQDSSITHKLQMIKKILLGNYKTSVAIAGTASLYNGLLQQSNGGTMHYVTGSPVNLYSKLENFTKLNGFPDGSMDMKIIGTNYGSNSLLDYKLSKIRALIKAYPSKKFLCFGDSGQQDPEIYAQIKKEYPKNILGIYINNVTKESKTSSRYKDELLTNSTMESAKDLFDKGLISQDFVNKVNSEVKY